MTWWPCARSVSGRPDRRAWTSPSRSLRGSCTRGPAAVSMTCGNWRRARARRGCPTVPRPSGGAPADRALHFPSTFAEPSAHSRLAASPPRAPSRWVVPAPWARDPSAACPTCASFGTRVSASGPSIRPPPGPCSRSTRACAPGRSTRATPRQRARYLDDVTLADPRAVRRIHGRLRGRVRCRDFGTRDGRAPGRPGIAAANDRSRDPAGGRCVASS